MKVHLKTRPTDKTRKKLSLYLVYTQRGKRMYEFLTLHIYNDEIEGKLIKLTSEQKKENKEILELAETIRAKKLLELQSYMHGVIPEHNKNFNFFTFYNKLLENRKSSPGNHGNWYSALKHLKEFTKKDDLTFGDVDERFAEEFKNYLLNVKKLSRNSAASYFNKFRATMNEAFDKRIIIDNPVKRVGCIKQEENDREYLSEEEVQRLIETECELPIFKKAFIFACFTGMRWSDCEALKWKDFQYKDGSWLLRFRQIKTKGQQYLPIQNQTMEWLGKVGKPEEKVFQGLEYSHWNNLKLARWIIKAGIDRKITFHCSRHTNATMLITNGTDLFVVSKLLGHKNISTTQIYAKVIDSKKLQAVNNIPKFKI